MQNLSHNYFRDTNKVLLVILAGYYFGTANQYVMDISKNIKSVRQRKGIKQVDMATLMNLERSNYSRIENKGNDISIKQLQEIADALQVPLMDLIFPFESRSLSKANNNLPKLIKENEDLLKYKSEVENIFKFITSYVPALEQMGFTEEKFSTQLDPDGRLKAYTLDRLEEMKGTIEYFDPNS